MPAYACSTRSAPGAPYSLSISAHRAYARAVNASHTGGETHGTGRCAHFEMRVTTECDGKHCMGIPDNFYSLCLQYCPCTAQEGPAIIKKLARTSRGNVEACIVLSMKESEDFGEFIHPRVPLSLHGLHRDGNKNVRAHCAHPRRECPRDEIGMASKTG
ncbi:hypothetical protein BC826DRAFT_71737 [Russula brevipes]|nr:hypothetical protein BC826DRAFT_71737 [Russula brevipes]